METSIWNSRICQRFCFWKPTNSTFYSWSIETLTARAGQSFPGFVSTPAMPRPIQRSLQLAASRKVMRPGSFSYDSMGDVGISPSGCPKISKNGWFIKTQQPIIAHHSPSRNGWLGATPISGHHHVKFDVTPCSFFRDRRHPDSGGLGQMMATIFRGRYIKVPKIPELSSWFILVPCFLLTWEVHLPITSILSRHMASYQASWVQTYLYYIKRHFCNTILNFNLFFGNFKGCPRLSCIKCVFIRVM